LGLTRREFVKLCMGSTMGAYLLSVLGPGFGNQLAFAADEKPVVIWLQGASCTGCSISLLNSVDPPIEKVLLDVISLRYHPNIMAASGHLCGEVLEEIARDYKGRFFLVVEGAIPTKDNGIYCTIAENKNIELTMLQAVNVLGNAATAVIAAGNCASFGGIPGAAPNPTGCVAVNKVVTKKPVINISCCPFRLNISWVPWFTS
jgi:Ni,Fe-hydrogenase I small subunit